MERESFEDDETARYLNEHFIYIKVDREQRPDLDALFLARAMAAAIRERFYDEGVFLQAEG